MMFTEESKKAQEIARWFEWFLDIAENKFSITYTWPKHDIARRFLNEIVEFKGRKGDA